MASKYDRFWRGRITQLGEALRRAAAGDLAEIDVASIKHLGHRASWYGSTRVRNGEVLAGNMAHAVSLGHQVVRSGILSDWPQTEFAFSISDGGRLTVRVHPANGTQEKPLQVETEDVQQARGRGEGTSITKPSEACWQIHDALAGLPVYRTPSDVPFTNGLYFYYERGEGSDHAAAERIVRIGNHPRAQNRLIGRLSDHHRTAANAKNGSVFRRYLGGALIRRRNPQSPCLAPGRGKGHWERQNDAECPRCTSVEQEVTAYLADEMYFRCVQVDNLELRNRLEKAIIATVAQCPVCVPGPEWLGRHAYPKEVRSTGLWNVQHTSDSSISGEDLRRLEALAGTSGTTSTPDMRPTGEGSDFSDTLLVIPCSGGKKGGVVPDLLARRVADYLDPASARILEEGRDLAFAREAVHLDQDSSLRTAITVYSGQPYATLGFRTLLVKALERGLHCLIVSGGYGIVRPEEPIHNYKAYMPSQTRGVWTRRLARLLPAYVRQNRISRTFISVSRSYASCLPQGFSKVEWWGVPDFDRRYDQGSPMRIVPAKVGALVVELLRNDMQPDGRWRRT